SRLSIFPYTTLFRSGACLTGCRRGWKSVGKTTHDCTVSQIAGLVGYSAYLGQANQVIAETGSESATGGSDPIFEKPGLYSGPNRSEEHTSELQSLAY